MATVVGGISPPPALVEQYEDVLDAALAVAAHFGVRSEVGLVAQAGNPGDNHRQFVANVHSAISTTVHTLVVVLVEGDSIRTEIQLVTTSELQGMQGLTAHGRGVFSVVQSSFRSNSTLSAQTENAVTENGLTIHAFSDGSDSGLGLDSLTGGGAGVNDAQASFLITTAQDSGASATTLADISKSLKLISKAGTTAAADLAVDVVALVIGDDASYDEIELNYGENTLVMANLEDMAGTTLVLTGMQKALVTGDGTVRIGDGEGSLLVGDSMNQAIFGGMGNDTLVGGGGRDTLVGGAGADVFGFNTRGHYTITDFVAGVDKAYFEFDGVTTAAQVKGYLTGITENNGSTTFHFGADASITLVGVSPNAVIGPLLFDV